jgi:hypothetical protein
VSQALLKQVSYFLVGKKEKPEEEEKKKVSAHNLFVEAVAGYGQIKNRIDWESYNMSGLNDNGPSQAGPASLVEHTRQRAIIELRKLGSQMPIEDLLEYALAVFDPIHDIHRPGLIVEPSSVSLTSSSSSSSS